MINSLRRLTSLVGERSYFTQQNSAQTRYRMVRHSTLNTGLFQFGSEHPASSYIETGQDFQLHGWIIGRDAPVTALRLSVVCSKRREFSLVTQFDHSPDLASHYPEVKQAENARFLVPLNDLPEWCQGQNFALELEACVNNDWHAVTTLTLVRDDYRNPAVFIVGSPRSGTTIVGNSIRKTLCSSEGYGESHVLPLSSTINQAIVDYHKKSGASRIPEMMLNHVNPHLLSEQMLAVLKSQFMNLTEDEWIVDKTPGGPMIRNLPFIQRLWPDARIVFVKRRGIENVASRLRKFPQVDFESHCKQWKNCMNAWLGVRENLYHTLEIDQYDVQTQPLEAAARLSEFLDLTATQRNYLGERFSEDRPEKTGTSTSATALDFEQLDWSDSEKNLFREHCANDLQKWGYSEDRNYYHRAAG